MKGWKEGIAIFGRWLAEQRMNTPTLMDSLPPLVGGSELLFFQFFVNEERI